MNVVAEQAAYLDAVRRALTDLDPQARDELLEDLPEHLAEVAAEGEGTLAERLGPPEAYAAELRAAAGLGTARAARGFDDRLAAASRTARGALGRADRKLGPVVGYGRASEFLRLLRPAWWVLRGYLVAMLITVMTTGGGFGLLPRLGGSTLAAVLLLAVCVLASIWLGRREPTLRPVPRAGIALAGVGLFIFGAVGFGEADRGPGDREPVEIVSGNPYEYIQDVYVYDQDGRPLTNVFLFDQDGNPIQLGDPYRCQEAYLYQTERGMTAAYPYCPNRPPYQIAPRPGIAETPQETVAPAPDPTAEPSESAPATATPEPSATS
ncbi:hypothetical protein O7635_03970 [Asanoa sp. WMMD1127]|uniref:HAAS signaling domain-containing protein n=1 Tax=Asanoa sp. WMMD1127 TaxID=3016107 RepID=UPI002416403F|nr:hypothetical protein [Asanoa sp. WMMD1127]MDG4821009.1 hypothetical protein [Asanoa sp. WMMD1127]